MTTAYLYKWTHLPSQKWYIGSKSSKNCHPNNHENYICSSTIVKPMVLEHRHEWVYEILVIGDPKYIRKLEATYLKLLRAKDDPMSFNRSNASCEYDRTGTIESAETRLKKSLARRGALNPSYGKTGTLSPIYGRKHSAETRAKQSAGLKKYNTARPEEHNKNISKALTGNPNVGNKGSKNWSYGKPEASAHLNATRATCEYCGLSTNIGNIARYHNAKCKQNPNKRN